MIVAIFGDVSAKDLEIADLFGITSITGFVLNDENSLPPIISSRVPCEIVPLETMIGDHDMALRQNHYRILLMADALVCQGKGHQHLVGIALSYGIPVMELP
jgi:hypothetical protein